MPNYPTSLDTLTNPAAADITTSPSHATQHTDANDIVEALEAKVGIGASTPTTTGHVLTVTGAGATAYQAAAGGSSIALKQQAASWGHYFALRTGVYYDGNMVAAGTSSQLLVANTLYFAPIYITTTTTFDRIGINVSTAGAAATAARLGIYTAHATTGQPNALVLDAGTVAVDAIAGVEITISQSLTGDTVYWLAMVTDGAPTVSFVSGGTSASAGLAAITASSRATRLTRSFTYAALPDPAGAGTYTAGVAVPSIRLRAV